jgi:TonB family protein
VNRRALTLIPALLGAALLLLTGCFGGAAGKRTATITDSAYSHQLNNRFHAAWQQPASVAATRGRITVIADVTIDLQGRVQRFKIVQPSGYAEVDESVRAAGRSVQQVEPPPLPTGNDRLQLRIYFDLEVKD